MKTRHQTFYRCEICDFEHLFVLPPLTDLPIGTRVRIERKNVTAVVVEHRVYPLGMPMFPSYKVEDRRSWHEWRVLVECLGDHEGHPGKFCGYSSHLFTPSQLTPVMDDLPLKDLDETPARVVHEGTPLRGGSPYRLSARPLDFAQGVVPSRWSVFVSHLRRLIKTYFPSSAPEEVSR